MNDIFKSIKAFLYDRSSSPLFGAFLIAWSAWNYRVFATLLSNETLSTKFTNIDKLFEAKNIEISGHQFTVYGELVNGLLVPALATAFYIYVYPVLAKPVYEHSLNKQKELRKIKQQEENNRLLSIEESRELYKRMSQLQDEFDKDTESYRKQISSLTETINELEQELASKTKQGDKLRNNDLFEIDKDLDELDASLREKVEAMPDREFQLSDLFDEDDWANLTQSDKQAIGKRFKRLVERGDYLGATLKRKGSGNQLIYEKSENKMPWPLAERLPDEYKNILTEFSSVPEGQGLLITDMKNVRKDNFEEVMMRLDELVDEKYLQYTGATKNNEKFYTLSSKGRKYLVDNKLLE